jgi:hypothetical protein
MALGPGQKEQITFVIMVLPRDSLDSFPANSAQDLLGQFFSVRVAENCKQE